VVQVNGRSAQYKYRYSKEDGRQRRHYRNGRYECAGEGGITGITGPPLPIFAFANVLLAVIGSRPNDDPLLPLLPLEPTSAILVYGSVIPKLAFGFGVSLLLYRVNPPPPSELAREDVREGARKSPVPLRDRRLNAVGVVPALRLASRWPGVVVAVLVLPATEGGSGNPAARAGVGAGYPVPNVPDVVAGGSAYMGRGVVGRRAGLSGLPTKD